MTPDVVVDIGNTRMKWGLCDGEKVVEVEAVPLNLGSVWHNRFETWHGESLAWAVAGSNPDRRDAFAAWLRDRGCQVTLLDDWNKFGIPVRINSPDRVGHDRLANARAAVAEVGVRKSVVVVSAGTAVTVDLVDESGAFAGGAIFPGVATMAKALNQFTVRLPEVRVDAPRPLLPGNATEPAIRAGVWWAVVGGVRAIVGEYSRRSPAPKSVLLTGGDADLIYPGLNDVSELRPMLTLDGIRIAAEALP